MDTIENSPQSEFDVFKERYLLTQALLQVTTSMERASDPEVVLRSICDALVSSSDHLQIAWMLLGDLKADELVPDYTAGNKALSVYENNPIRRDKPLPCCPVFSAIDSWSVTTCNVDNKQTDNCCMCTSSIATLPVGKKDSDSNGIVTLCSDMPSYFETVGTGFFTAFMQLANSSLEQFALFNELSHLASHDLLTGLLNRRGIEEAMDKELARCKRHDLNFSIILFDADRFKLINDRLGHKEGDLVLKGIANIASLALREEDCVGRWGGEEFICLLPGSCHEDAMQIAERMRVSIKNSPVDTSSGEVLVTASFGIATYPEDGDELAKIIAAADTALYQSKRLGRDRCISAHNITLDVHGICNALDQALLENRIVPAYQPIVNLKTGEVVAEETLARLLSPDGEAMPAADFIGAAHQLQLLHRIDATIILQAFSHCVTGLSTGTNRLSHFVNVSADLLRHSDLVSEILEKALESCSECADLIGETKPMVIEITERELFDDIEVAKELLKPFTDFGLRLALDDFGSGYSSYKYLADLPVSFIKIDGELVKRVREPKVRAIIQGIQDTASALEIITVAEFVEDTETDMILKEIGIDWAQGYLYGKPQVH